jgi:hypothetical protein
MNLSNKGLISITLLLFLQYTSSVWACYAIPKVHVLVQAIDEDQANWAVGETIEFNANGSYCDDAGPLVFSWSFPPQAYCIEIYGDKGQYAKCKFSPAGIYPVQLAVMHEWYKNTGYWENENDRAVGCEDNEITINGYTSPVNWYVRTDGNDDNDGRSNSIGGQSNDYQGAFQNIQTAIDSASDEDVIIVDQGIYRESVSLKGKDLTICSTDPENWSVVENTIINGHGQGAVVFFEGSETSACQLKGITVMGGGISYEDPLDDYLEGHWKLNEDTGTDVPDSSGNEGRSGELKPTGGGPTWDPDGGRVAGCLSFDGDDYVEMSDYYGVGGTQARTTSAWIKLSSSGSSRTILSYGGTTERSVWLFMVNENNKLQLGVYNGNIIGNPVLATNRWYHVAAVLDDWNGDGLKVNDLRLYIDGKQVTGTYLNSNEALTTGNTYPVRIGAHTSTNYKFIGLIDDVRLYRKALTESEIQSLVGDPGKVAHWKLDNDYNDTANGHHGTPVGDPGFEEGKIDQGICFDGTGQYIQIEPHPTLEVKPPIAMMSWIYLEQPNVQGVFIGTNVGSGVYSGAYLQINSGVIELKYGDGGGTGSGNRRSKVTNTPVLETQRWYHVAGVIRGPLDMSIYIDGIDVGGSYSGTGGNIYYSQSGYPRIGALPFNGMMDDVRIYNRAVSDADIRSIYTQGSGIYGNGTLATISNCVIRNNTTPFDGGGIWNVDGTITNCFILNNQSQANGGGLADCDGLIANCVLAENTSENAGAILGGSGTLINCTIADNSADTSIGGVKDYNGTITNTILWGNTDSDGATTTEQAQIFGGSPTVNHSCIQGWTGGGTGNIDNDPCFINSILIEGEDGLIGTYDDKYTITQSSLCIDAGDHVIVANNQITTDIVGCERIMDGNHDGSSTEKPDMGTYEYRKIIYIDCLVESNGDGTSWLNAFKYLNAALSAASSGCEIWVADGTYKPGQDASNPDGLSTASFSVPSNVKLYGGFAGSETALSQRDPSVYKTMLNGNINGSYCYTVVNLLNNGTLLDGISIQSGGTYGIWSDGQALGQLVFPIVRNCVIENNKTGVLAYKYSSLIVENCKVINNTEAISVYSYNTNITSTPIIRGCEIQNNGVTGISISGDCNVTIQNCLIANNDTGTANYSRGIYSYSGICRIINCTIVGHNKNSYSRGVYVFSTSYAEIKNSIIWDNYDDLNIYCTPDKISLSYCCIEDTLSENEGIGVIHSNPLFADPANGDYRLKNHYGRWNPATSSWVEDTGIYNPCVDAGDPFDDYSNEINVPLGTNGGRVNMGAYGNTQYASKSADSDGDDLSDTWEMRYFGNLNQEPWDNPEIEEDADEFSNEIEYLFNYNPVLQTQVNYEIIGYSQSGTNFDPTLEQTIAFDFLLNKSATLRFKSLSSTDVFLEQTNPVPAGPCQIIWDGTATADNLIIEKGIYSWQLETTDPTPAVLVRSDKNAYDSMEPINLTYDHQISNLLCNPTRIIPNFGEITTISYNFVLSDPLTEWPMTVKVYDSDEALFRTVIDQTQTEGDKSVTWDGKSGLLSDPDSDRRYPSKEGEYTVEVRFSGMREKATQKINMYK